MATTRKTTTTNPELFNTIRALKKKSNETGLGVYRAVAKKLSTTASQRSRVNLSRIEKYANAGETIIVPGKVLGDGTLTKKVTIVGFSISDSALAKLQASKSTFIPILEYLEQKQDAKLRIFG
jgi:large subunit ribosomal protein L18e